MVSYFPSNFTTKQTPQQTTDVGVVVDDDNDVFEEEMLSEIIFLIDRSGSMSGNRINQV